MIFDWFKKPRPDGAPAAGEADAAPADLPLEAVARRAYEIWCRNGRPSDSQVPDWLAAEAELRTEMERGPAPPAGP